MTNQEPTEKTEESTVTKDTQAPRRVRRKRLTEDQWESARIMRARGATFDAVAEAFGVSKAGVIKRSQKEGWATGEDVQSRIRTTVANKVARITNGDPKKIAKAIDIVSDEAAEVVLRHRRELQEHVDTFKLADIAADFNLGKSAKISAEMLTIRQKAERIAWSLDDQTIRFDFQSATDEELEKLAAGILP